MQLDFKGSGLKTMRKQARVAFEDKKDRLRERERENSRMGGVKQHSCTQDGWSVIAHLYTQ